MDGSRGEVRSKGRSTPGSPTLLAGGGYWVCMPMRELPGAVLGSKDHRSPRSGWGSILPTANLGLCPLYLYNVGYLGSLRPGGVVEVNHAALETVFVQQFELQADISG
jgi:hypothetical protein